MARKSVKAINDYVQGEVTQQYRVSPSNRNLGKQAFMFTRNEINILLPQYIMIRDAIDGEMAIKGMVGLGSIFPTAGQSTFSCSIDLSRSKRYLPMPNAEDQSKQNQERYKAYVQRAVYYNVISRTLDGMSGQIFLRDPD